MKAIKIYILFIFLSLSSISIAQFSIDVYSGYNHSKKEYTLPSNFHYCNMVSYYSGNVRDTIYNAFGIEDSIIIRYEQISVVNDYGSTYHNFASNYIYGINLQYAYAKYFSTAISFEKHGFTRDASSISINLTDERFSHECMCEDSLIYAVHDTVLMNSTIINSSFTQSFYFPYKRFKVFADFGISAYYTFLDFIYSGHKFSVYHPIYNRKYIYDITSKIVKQYEGYSFGYKFAMGVSYNLCSNVSIFGSVGYTKANLHIRKGIFVSEDPPPPDYSYYDPDYVMPTYPHELSQDDIPFGKIDYSSWNFKIGLRYTFGKKEKSEE